MSLDLHIHSSFSDGSMTPEELVILAKKKGLEAISITDHDNMDSVPEALAASEKYGLKIIPGLELSVMHGNVSLHLLGYLFDHESLDLRKLLSRIQGERTTRNDEIIDQLLDIEIDIKKEVEEITGSNNQIGRPHIAQILVKKKYAKNVNDAFRKYLTPGGLAYSRRTACSVIEAIEILHKANGLAVLAHPLNINTSDADIEKFFDELVSHGLDGIEAYYPTHSKKTSKKFEEYAAKNGLICTGGSDYHGSFRSKTYLAGGKNVFVPEHLLSNMLEKHQTLYL